MDFSAFDADFKDFSVFAVVVEVDLFDFSDLTPICDFIDLSDFAAVEEAPATVIVGEVVITTGAADGTSLTDGAGDAVVDVS